jgi:hypothetical protein
MNIRNWYAATDDNIMVVVNVMVQLIPFAAQRNQGVIWFKLAVLNLLWITGR